MPVARVDLPACTQPYRVKREPAIPEHAARRRNRAGLPEIRRGKGSLNGDGTFIAGETYSGFGAADGLATADLNGNGKLDLPLLAGGGVQVLIGHGDGSFSAPVLYTAGDESADGIGTET